MSGVNMSVELDGTPQVLALLGRATHLQLRQLHGSLAFTAENFIRRRITQEKSGPSGRWVKWSTKYAASGRGRALLEQSGGMRDSFTSTATEEEARVGTRKAQAATMNFGDNRTIQIGAHTRRITRAFGRAIEPKDVNVAAHSLKRNIPARPFMWFSQQNSDELRDTAMVFLEASVQP